eukprot:scaffold5944_cov101-Amphora_coffeaeformis.AAC.9
MALASCGRRQELSFRYSYEFLIRAESNSASSSSSFSSLPPSRRLRLRSYNIMFCHVHLWKQNSSFRSQTRPADTGSDKERRKMLGMQSRVWKDMQLWKMSFIKYDGGCAMTVGCILVTSTFRTTLAPALSPKVKWGISKKKYAYPHTLKGIVNDNPYFSSCSVSHQKNHKSERASKRYEYGT